jgi:hypothetical protein
MFADRRRQEEKMENSIKRFPKILPQNEEEQDGEESRTH